LKKNECIFFLGVLGVLAILARVLGGGKSMNGLRMSMRVSSPSASQVENEAPRPPRRQDRQEEELMHFLSWRLGAGL
jgi:hypothetical protein